VHVAGADLHHEQAVQALEGDRAVHVEESRWRASSRLARAGTAARSYRCAAWAPEGCSARLEDPADRRCADPVAELEQLALDPLVSSAVVLGGEPPDERGDLWADWRSARAAGIGHFLVTCGVPELGHRS
jgi:hypothetical protein